MPEWLPYLCLNRCLRDTYEELYSLNEPAIINLPTEQAKRDGYVRKPLEKKLKCWTTAIAAENIWDLLTKMQSEA